MKYDVEIKRMKESQIPALANLYKQFWGEESSIDKMQDTFYRLSKNGNYIFLSALVEKELVGSIYGIVCEELYGECKPFMVVEDFIIDAAWRRKGIGRKLMNCLEIVARERECCHILLITDTDRNDAQSFYVSLGFNPNTHKGFKKTL